MGLLPIGQGGSVGSRLLFSCVTVAYYTGDSQVVGDPRSIVSCVYIQHNGR